MRRYLNRHYLLDISFFNYSEFFKILLYFTVFIFKCLNIFKNIFKNK